MLGELAIKNIKYYIKSYLVYVLSIGFNGWIYYMFSVFLKSDVGKDLVSKNVYNVLMNVGMLTILFFSMIFTYYSISFFMRKRSREIGMYFLLGISKTKVILLLYIESVVTAMLGVVTGIFVGLFTNKPLMAIVYRIVKENLTNMNIVDFSVILPVLAKFFILISVIALINLIFISKAQLVELFKKNNKEQKPIKVGPVRTIVSFMILIVGYVCIFKAKDSETIHFLSVGVVLVVAGTFFIFNQFVVGFTRYLRNSNFIAKNFVRRINTNSISFRINENSMILSAMSILISASIGLTVLAISLTDITKRAEKSGHPFTCIYEEKNIESQKAIDKYLTSSGLKKRELEVKTVVLPTKSNKKTRVRLGKDTTYIRILSNKDLKRLKALKKVDYKRDIKAGECIYLRSYLDDEVMEKGKKVIKFSKKQLSPKIIEITKNNPVLLDDEYSTIALNDHDFDKLAKNSEIKKIKIYDLDEDKKIDDAVFFIMQSLGRGGNHNLNSDTNIISLNMTSVFIMIIVGISASLLSSIGSILYFWILSEIKEEEESYKIYYSLGASKSILSKIISRQVGILFFLPYLVSFINVILFTKFLQDRKFLYGIWIAVFSMLVYSLIYIAYYMFTRREARKVIENYR